MTSLLTQMQNETAAEIGMDVQRVAKQGMAVHGNDPKALQVLAAGIATGIEALEREHPQLIVLVSNILALSRPSGSSGGAGAMVDGTAWTNVWHNGIAEFSACNTAERFLVAAGFSVGRMQRGSPRGILFGDYDIQKWRNLNTAERSELHGQMTGSMRDGPVTVAIFASAPAEAVDALTRGER